jgi:hypothetical protein
VDISYNDAVATVQLENPREHHIPRDDICQRMAALFGLDAKKVSLKLTAGQAAPADLISLSGQTLLLHQN